MMVSPFGDARMRCYELTDAAWARLEPLMPPTDRPGGRWRDHRMTLNGMFWVINSGAPWRDMPQRYGQWKAVYGRYRRWAREGLFDRMLNTLHLQLDEPGRIDWSQFDVDGTNIRADHGAAGASKKGDPATNSRTTGWDLAAGVGAASFT